MRDQQPAITRAPVHSPKREGESCWLSDAGARLAGTDAWGFGNDSPKGCSSDGRDCSLPPLLFHVHPFFRIWDAGATF